MNPVSIVTVKSKSPLYKGEELANKIELIELEEVGFDLVSQKDLYNVGDKVVFIQPDYCVSDIPLFESFIRPGGDESKSMLGKVGGLARRIRAKKFSLSKIPNGDPVYSNGILLPVGEVFDYLYCDMKHWSNEGKLLRLSEIGEEFKKFLGITKYEESEHTNKYGIKTGAGRVFPQGVYKTDEQNINNLWNHLENKIGYPLALVGTEKVDGSSITIGVKPNGEGFICSRNLQKLLYITKAIGQRKATFWERIKQFLGFIVDLNIYEEVENDDDFVKYGKPYLDKMISAGYKGIVFRGELNGGSLKGSGNKHNPASKEQANIKFFGADYFDNLGVTVKLPHRDFIKDVYFICGDENFVTPVFNAIFNSKEELCEVCDDYFKSNLIEGIVVRTLDSEFSAKYMNPEYDSKK